MSKTHKSTSSSNLKEKTSRLIKQKSWKQRIESHAHKDDVDGIDNDVDIEFFTKCAAFLSRGLFIGLNLVIA